MAGLPFGGRPAPPFGAPPGMGAPRPAMGGVPAPAGPAVNPLADRMAALRKLKAPKRPPSLLGLKAAVAPPPKLDDSGI